MFHTRGSSLVWRVGRRSLEGRVASPSQSSRKFSSFQLNPISRPALPSNPILSSSSASCRSRILLTSSAAYAQTRFNSSSSDHQEPHVPLNPLTSPEDYKPEEIFDADVLINADVADRWYAGYLNEQIGGFGWGPTSTVQWVLEHVHMYDEASIGVSIVLTAALLRIITFPLNARASDMSARLQSVSAEVKPKQQAMKTAAQEQNTMEVQRLRAEVRQVYNGAGVKLTHLALPMIQIPIGFGFWRLLRNMAFLPVPGMSAGGLFWFPNLLAHDPYFFLPIMTGVLQHLSFRLGGDTGNTDQTTGNFRRTLMWVLPVLTPLFIGWAPAAIQLSFFTSAFFGLISNFILRNAAARRMINLTPTYKPAVKILNTTGKIREIHKQPQQPLTVASKAKAVLDNLSVSNLKKKAEKTQEGFTNMISGPGSPLAMFRKDPNAKPKVERARSTDRSGAASKLARDSNLAKLRSARKGKASKYLPRKG